MPPATSRFVVELFQFVNDIVFHLQHLGVRRADPDRLREVFDRFASVEKNGNRYMTSEDFVRSYLGLYEHNDYNKKTVRLVGNIVDTSKDG